MARPKQIYIEGVSVKTCSGCNKTLLANGENFYNHKSGLFGFTPKCKICTNIHNKELYKCCNFTIIELPVNDIKVRITKDFVYLEQNGGETVVNRDEAVNVFECVVKAIKEAGE